MIHSYISSICLVLKVVGESPVNEDGICVEDGDDFVEFVVFLWGEAEFEV